MAHDIFISYSSKDKNVANAVCAALEQNHIRCWIASRDVTPGKEWGEEIVQAITNSKVMVLIFSSAANQSQQVLREVERAVNKNIIIIPFRIEDVYPTKSMEYFLYSTHWLDALTPDLEKHIEKLVKTVGKLMQAPENPKFSHSPIHNNKRKIPSNKYIWITAVTLALIALMYGLMQIFDIQIAVKPDPQNNSQNQSTTNTLTGEPKNTQNGDKKSSPEENLVKDNSPNLNSTAKSGETLALPQKEDFDQTVATGQKIQLKIGDYLSFGRYNGELITWRVININKDGLPFLLSERILCKKAFSAAESGTCDQMKSGEKKSDFYKYDEDIIKRYTMAEIREMRGNNHWSSSNLRDWLNSKEMKVKFSSQPPSESAVWNNAYENEPGFLTNFTSEELSLIKPISHKEILPVLEKEQAEGGDSLFDIVGKKYNLNDLKMVYSRAYYKKVVDRVFLLSIEELNEYVINRGWKLKPGYWWLRTPNAVTSYSVLGNNESGVLTSYSAISSNGVRPALVLTTSQLSMAGLGTEVDPYVPNFR